MFSAHPYRSTQAYERVGVDAFVETATPHRLVTMLFDGARAALLQAGNHLRGDDIQAKGEAISKAIAIIDGGLRASLDLSVGGELARNLHDLYGYMTRRLLQANLHNDLRAIEEVIDLLQQLGSAWASLSPAIVPVADPSMAARPQGEATSYGSV